MMHVMEQERAASNTKLARLQALLAQATKVSRPDPDT